MLENQAESTIQRRRLGQGNGPAAVAGEIFAPDPGKIAEQLSEGRNLLDVIQFKPDTVYIDIRGVGALINQYVIFDPTSKCGNRTLPSRAAHAQSYVHLA